MSAQAGIFYFDGRPIGPALPGRLDAQLAEFGPDGRGQYVAPGLVMVHRALHVTPEDPLESQPYVSARGHVMTWDGRLDNREELLLQLWRELDKLDGDSTDVALAMAAYEKWGVDGLAKLIGDWSLAVARPAERRVTLASDFAGVRPLYVRHARDHVAWSTSLASLIDPAQPPELDPRFVVGCITFANYPEATAYRDVRFVAAGHAETWNADGRAARTPFWRPPANRIRYANDSDYADHLRSLFAEAVRVRLRATRPVWIEVSGGFDSSSIACMADSLVRTGRTATGMATISYISDAVRASDERPFIEAVEQHIGCGGRHVRIEDVVDLVDDSAYALTPRHPSGCLLAFLRIVRDSGSRLLLSGSPGDLIMGNSVDASVGVLEDLADGAPLRALANLREWSRSSQHPIWTLARRLLIHCGSRRTQMAHSVERTLHRHGVSTRRNPLAGARELFLLTDRGSLMWLENVLAMSDQTLDEGAFAKRELVRGLLSGARGRFFAAGSELGAVHRSYPYIHRPLVDFVLGIPLGRLCRPGEPRALMRDAFAPILPRRILGRHSKGYVAPFHHRSVQSVLPDLRDRLETFHLVRMGIVDRQRLTQRIDAFRQGATRQLGNLLPIVGFERWVAGLHMRAQYPMTKGGEM